MDELWVLWLIYAFGLAMFLAEIFIPSAGTIGALGLLCVGYTCWRFFATDHLFFGVLATAAAFLYAYFVVRHGLKRTTIGTDLSGATSVAPGSFAPSPGTSGITTSPLRPAGVATICGRRVDVITRGEFIEAGSAVVVVESSGHRIVVREQPAEGATAP